MMQSFSPPATGLPEVEIRFLVEEGGVLTRRYLDCLQEEASVKPGIRRNAGSVAALTDRPGVTPCLYFTRID